MIWLNCDPSRGVISDPKMRWAINYCLDREKIGKAIWPVEVPPAVYPWADYPTNDKWKNDELANKYKFEFNPQKATELLDEIAPKGAGGKRMYKGKEINLEIITPSPVDGGEYAIANVLKGELAKVGVPATLRSLSGSVHDEKFQRGDVRHRRQLGRVRVRPRAAVHRLGERQGPADRQERRRQEQAAVPGPEVRRARPRSWPGWTRPARRPSRCSTRRWRSTSRSCRCCPVIQTGYPSYFNTAFWTGWPTDEDLYEVPLNWWPHFIFVLGKIEATGQKGPA